MVNSGPARCGERPLTTFGHLQDGVPASAAPPTMNPHHPQWTLWPLFQTRSPRQIDNCVCREMSQACSSLGLVSSRIKQGLYRSAISSSALKLLQTSNLLQSLRHHHGGKSPLDRVLTHSALIFGAMEHAAARPNAGVDDMVPMEILRISPTIPTRASTTSILCAMAGTHNLVHAMRREDVRSGQVRFNFQGVFNISDPISVGTLKQKMFMLSLLREAQL